MATQKELAQQLTDIAAGLKNANDALGGVQTEIGKVSGETSTLLQNVKDLQDALANQTGASQELQDAVAAVAAQAATVQTGVATVQTGINAVDALVPDAPPAPTPAP